MDFESSAHFKEDRFEANFNSQFNLAQFEKFKVLNFD